MDIAATAVATANPPAEPPACVFPIGLSSCPFTSPTGLFGSNGCGVNIKFIDSNGQVDSTNTAAWLNMGGAGAPADGWPNYLQNQVNAANNNACAAPPTLGTQHGVNNGMITPAFDATVAAFKAHFGGTHEIKNAAGDTTYNGPGWEISVPIIQTEPCPPAGITGDHKIIGWTRMVMTQAWDNTGNNKSPIGEGCVVSNDKDTETWKYCTMAKKDLPKALSTGNSRSLWGYYSCQMSNKPPVVEPLPRAALATKLRLVR
jgi:hypothetical protein